MKALFLLIAGSKPFLTYPSLIVLLAFQVQSVDWQFIKRKPFQTISVQTSSTLVNDIAILTFNMELESDVQFENQDKIYIEIPRTSQFINQKAFFPYPSTDTANCYTNDPNFAVDTCNVQSMKINMTIIALTAGYTSQSLSLSFKNFKNPYSTFPLKIFEVTVTKVPALGYGADWEDMDYERERQREKGYENTTLTLSGLLPDAIAAVSVTPLNLTVAAKPVSVRLSVRSKNEVRRVSMLSFFIPLWNPDEGTKGKHHVLASTPYCKGKEGLGPMFSCSYESAIQTLYIFRPVEETVPGGTVFTFEMDSFWNPYSGKPKHGFHCYILDQDYGIVDSSQVAGLDITMTVSEWSYLPSVKILRPDISKQQRTDGAYDSSTTIRYQSAGMIVIFMDMPVDANCRIEVKFPADMPLTDDLQKVSSEGILGSPRVPPTHIDIPNRSFYLDGCSAYMPQISNTLWMYNMRNKDMVRQTESFALYLWTIDTDGSVHKVAKKEDNIFLFETDFSVGSVVSLFVTAVDTYIIRRFTKYAVQFKTVDPIPNNSKIKVRFPTTITLVPGQCQLQTVTFPFNINADCQVSKNTITITYPFVNQEIYDPRNGTGISIGFSFNTGGTNPIVACDAGQFLVTTFAIFDGKDYAIDYYQFYSRDDKLPRFAAFIPVADQLKVEMMRPDNEITYSGPTKYTLKLYPNLVTPQYSLLQVTFPPEIQLMEGLTVINCRAYLASGMVIASSVPEAMSPLTFTMTTIFTAGPYTTLGTPFNLECDGLQNPKSLNPTSSFALATYDQNGCGIERVNTGIIIQMYGLPSFKNVSVYSEVPNNGQLSKLVLLFQAYVSFSDHYTIQLKFPPEVTVPDNPECLPANLSATAFCYKMSENRLTANLTFTSPPVLQDIWFGFKLDKIKNPISMMPTRRFSEIYAYDKLSNIITNYTAPGPILTNPLPAVANGTMDQSDKDVGVEAEYRIYYTTVNDMPKGAAFIINYTSTVDTIITGLNTSLVYYQNVAYPQGWFINTTDRTIQIRRGLPIAVPSGSQLKIVFGPIVNPQHQKVDNISFTLTSYTDTTFQYSIDQVQTDLIPKYTCHYPCRRCPSRQQYNVCLSCFTNISPTIIPEQYLNGTKCVAECPSGTQSNDKKICLGLKTSVLEITSFEANYQPTYYSLKIHPSNFDIFQNLSVLRVRFPSEIKVATGESAQSTVCASHVYIPPWQKYINIGTTEVIEVSPNVIVEVYNVFNSNLVYKPGTIVTLKCGKLRNPRLLDPTSDIIVSHRVGNSAIYSPTWNFKVQMKKFPSFQDVNVTLLSYQTGATTEYNFAFIAGHEMVNQQIIAIDLTTDITLLEDDPLTTLINEGITCIPDGVILTGVTCSIEKMCISALDSNPQTQLPTGKLLATLTFASGIIKSGVRFSFKVQNVRNPPNTKPIQIQSIEVYDIGDKKVIQKYSIKPYPVIKMVSAAIIVQKSIHYEIPTVNQQTNILINFKTINRMPSDCVIVVTYPPNAVFIQNQLVASTVYVDNIWRGSSVQVDFIRRKILLQLQNPPESTLQEIPRGAIIDIRLRPFKNTALSATESFQVQTFTNKDLRYLVDEIPSGQLFLFSCEAGYYQELNTCIQCQYPCKTCLSASLCLTCYSDTDVLNVSRKSFLYNGNCFQKVDQCSV